MPGFPLGLSFFFSTSFSPHTLSPIHLESMKINVSIASLAQISNIREPQVPFPLENHPRFRKSGARGHCVLSLHSHASPIRFSPFQPPYFVRTDGSAKAPWERAIWTLGD
jgi:hypothetical protein